jgi:hypothetical protein
MRGRFPTIPRVDETKVFDHLMTRGPDGELIMTVISKGAKNGLGGIKNWGE